MVRGGALIELVALQDNEGRRLDWIVGGEEVTVCLRARVQSGQPLIRPIMGFYVKDRLGQALFGDNTFLVYQDEPVLAEPGSLLVARFRFRMPILPHGDYTISAAIADGTQHDHIQHHWWHDALYFKSHSSSQSHGLAAFRCTTFASR